MARFPRVLRELRERSGLSIETFCKRAGMKPSRLEQLEAPGSNPRINELIDIAHALRMRPATLFNRMARSRSAGRRT